MSKSRVSTGTKWEGIVGYSRAIRLGNHIEISGTVAVDESGRVVGKGDPAAQAEYIFEKVEKVLGKLGASLYDVIRTRMYVMNIDDWEPVGRVHGEYFSEIKPATSMVEVSALIGPEYLVEVEVSALLNDSNDE